MSSDTPGASSSRLNAAQEGVLCAVTAFFLWGLSAWFYKVIEYVPAYEVIAHRVVWSVPLAAVVLIVIGRTGDIPRAFKTPKILLTLIVTASLVSLNWLLYVWAVVGGYALEASLGYFINPLMSVLLGLVLLREKLLPAQAVAVGLAVVAVIIQTVLVGTFPWLALTLASTFATYGYLRKTIDIGPAQGFLVEVILFLPLALGYLIWIGAQGEGHFGSTAFDTVWLILAGPDDRAAAHAVRDRRPAHQALDRRPLAIHRAVLDLRHRDLRLRRAYESRALCKLCPDLARPRDLFRLRRPRRPSSARQGPAAGIAPRP